MQQNRQNRCPRQTTLTRRRQRKRRRRCPHHCQCASYDWPYCHRCHHYCYCCSREMRQVCSSNQPYFSSSSSSTSGSSVFASLQPIQHFFSMMTIWAWMFSSWQQQQQKSQRRSGRVRAKSRRRWKTWLRTAETEKENTAKNMSPWSKADNFLRKKERKKNQLGILFLFSSSRLSLSLSLALSLKLILFSPLLHTLFHRSQLLLSLETHAFHSETKAITFLILSVKHENKKNSDVQCFHVQKTQPAQGN